MNKRIKWLIISSIVTGCLISEVFADEINTANNIRSVWNQTSQYCSGLSGAEMHRHPRESDIQSSKEITFPEIGMQLTVPQVPGVKDTHVKVFFGDKGRGVVDNYILFSKADTAPPVAAIVITELPKNLKTTDQALTAVMKLQQKSANDANMKLPYSVIQSIHGKGLEFIVDNRIGSSCYPTSNFKFKRKGKWKKTIGISRFVVIDKKLIEFAMIVEYGRILSHKKGVAKAKVAMDEFWKSLTPLKRNNFVEVNS